MLTAADNDLLTLTGPDQPMGQYFRRYWQPVALSRELPERDGPPIRVQVMGEKLLAFRDTQGRVGLIEPVCPHRGADLYYGRNENCGLRCVFHGWKFGVDGKAMDLPNVAPDSNYHETMSVKAYPTQEYGDIVWAYMGPRTDDGAIPDVPELEFGAVPSSRRYVTKKRQECNWAQAIEGALDTSHFSFLHMPAPHVPSNENDDAPADEKRLAWIRRDPMPKFSILDHEVGFVVGGARRADGRDIYWRTAQFALPSHSTTPSTLPGENYFGYTFVPIDDHACWIYTYVWNPERDLTDKELSQLKSGHGVVAEVDEHYIPLRNLTNGYLMDRREQKHKTYTGVRGVAEQDAMIQESQGLIADRTREHLTATDAAIVRFRRTLIADAKALAQGKQPQAPWRHEAYRLRSGSWIAAEGRSFEEIMQERFGSVTGRVEKARA